MISSFSSSESVAISPPKFVRCPSLLYPFPVYLLLDARLRKMGLSFVALWTYAQRHVVFFLSQRRGSLVFWMLI